MNSIWHIGVDAGTAPINREEVRQVLGLLVDPDAVHELRGLPSGRSHTIRGNDLDAAVRAAEDLAGDKGVYITLNPVRPNLTGAARASDILKRRHILIDCDRRHNKDHNATEAEKEAARHVADHVLCDLTARGWPRPIVLDSGNGWHLLYAADMGVDKLAQQIIARCLKALAAAHNTEDAEVDTKVHNASRITKLPGTWVRKGPHSDARPHRMARLVSVPTAITHVTVEQLKELAGVTQPKPYEIPADIWVMPVRRADQSRAGYAREALAGEYAELSVAPEGARNERLNLAAFRVGQLLHLGLDRRTTELALLNAARQCGLGEIESVRTVRSGLDAGAANPRYPKERDGESPRQALPAMAPDAKLTIRASEIQPRAVCYLWRDRVPIGFITVFAGRTGLGKSFVTCDLAARITQGEDLPDGPSGLAGECRNVLFISEDPYDYVLAPRLTELGADLGRISFLRWEAMARYTLGDTEFLERAFQEAEEPALVVIDPPTNFLGDDIDEHKNSAVRALLMHLVQWIKDKDAACVMITHVNKSTGKGVEAINRVIGSVAWTTIARVAHSFAPDPDTAGECLFLPMKNNLGPIAKGLSYRIVKTDTLATVQWTGEVDLSADEAMSGEKRKPRRVIASEWLAQQFRARREWPSNEITDAGKEHGVSRSALWEAKGCLPIDARKRTTADGEPVWYWVARADWPPPLET